MQTFVRGYKLVSEPLLGFTVLIKPKNDNLIFFYWTTFWKTFPNPVFIFLFCSVKFLIMHFLNQKFSPLPLYQWKPSTQNHWDMSATIKEIAVKGGLGASLYQSGATRGISEVPREPPAALLQTCTKWALVGVHPQPSGVNHYKARLSWQEVKRSDGIANLLHLFCIFLWHQLQLQLLYVCMCSHTAETHS